MKKVLFVSASLIFLASCGGGASEEQTKAAKELCDCISNGETGDFDIDYSMCDMELRENYPGEVTADDGFTTALEEQCPEVASKLTENE